MNSIHSTTSERNHQSHSKIWKQNKRLTNKTITQIETFELKNMWILFTIGIWIQIQVKIGTFHLIWYIEMWSCHQGLREGEKGVHYKNIL